MGDRPRDTTEIEASADPAALNSTRSYEGSRSGCRPAIRLRQPRPLNAESTTGAHDAAATEPMGDRVVTPVSYARVSTRDQDGGSQVHALIAAGAVRVFVDHGTQAVSATVRNGSRALTICGPVTPSTSWALAMPRRRFCVSSALLFSQLVVSPSVGAGRFDPAPVR